MTSPLDHDMPHERRKTPRTPEQRARLRALRDKYQREKPSPDELLAQSGADDFVPLGEVLRRHEEESRRRKEQA